MNLLEQTRPYFEQLEKRVLTIRKLAQILQCNESYLSRTLSGHVKRAESTTKTREKAHVLFKCRQQMREKHALLVKNGSKSLRKAAADARCSQRTLRRYILNLKD